MTKERTEYELKCAAREYLEQCKLARRLLAEKRWLKRNEPLRTTRKRKTPKRD